jgi:hypothetical protein
MESVAVAPSPAAAAVAEQKLKLLEQKMEPLPPAAAAKAKAPASACKWAMKKKLVGGDAGYVLEDVPHLTDYLPELLVRASAPVLLAVPRFSIGSCSPDGQFELGVELRTASLFLRRFCGFAPTLVPVIFLRNSQF